MMLRTISGLRLTGAEVLGEGVEWDYEGGSRGVSRADKQLSLPLCPLLSAGQKANGTGSNGVLTAVEDTEIYTYRSV